MEKNKLENSNQIISNEKHLIYTDEFKDFIKENPGVIKSVHLALKGKDINLNFKEINGVKITKIELSTIPVYKIEKNNQAFFVKINHLPNQALGEKGFDEFKSTEQAKELIKDLPWVDVAEYQLGYKDDKYAYYVSKWNEILSSFRLDEHLDELKKICH